MGLKKVIAAVLLALWGLAAAVVYLVYNGVFSQDNIVGRLIPGKKYASA